MAEKNRTELRRILAIRYFIEFTLTRMLMALINCLPIAASTWIARRIGEVMFFVMPDRRRVALGNLAIAFGNSKSPAERKKIAIESFRHMATCAVEFFRLPGSVEKIGRHFTFQGSENLQRAFARNKGVILVMSHLGPWEYLGYLSYLKKVPIAALVRPIKNPYFYRWIKLARKTVDVKSLDKDLGPKRMLQALRQNQMVAIAIDQWAGNDGLWIDFFGRPTSTISLPARLVEKTGSALIPAACIRTAPGKYEIQILPEPAIKDSADNWVQEMTKELNRILEQQISSFPEQWLWTHKRWKKSREGIA